MNPAAVAPSPPADHLLQMGYRLLGEARDAAVSGDDARTRERLRAARLVAASLPEDSLDRQRLIYHGRRVRNFLTNRQVLAQATAAEAAVLGECVYCQEMFYLAAAEESVPDWEPSRCVVHQDAASFPPPDDGPSLPAVSGPAAAAAD